MIILVVFFAITDLTGGADERWISKDASGVNYDPQVYKARRLSLELMQ